jgi:hypothetical protein
VKKLNEGRGKQMLSDAQIPTDARKKRERPGTRLMNDTPDCLPLPEPRDPGGATKGEEAIWHRVDLYTGQHRQSGGLLFPETVAVEGTSLLTARIAVPRSERDPGSDGT